MPHCRWAASIALLCVALLGGVQGASAQYFGRNKVQYDQFQFEVLPTNHFDLYFYEETTTAARDAARMADRWYARHSTIFSHELTARRPLIFYANDADFQQTTVVGGAIGEGVGGLTEGLKQRVVMPFTGLYGETDHVLGHELVHSFQYDLALSTGRGIQLRRLPLWVIEGMAEYLSLGAYHPHTAMWIRDALVRDDLPTIRDLGRGRYFPYRFGQAYMAYLGGTYGDGAVATLYQVAGQTGLEAGLETITGLSPDTLSADWIQTVRASYGPLVDGRTPAADAGTPVLTPASNGDINVAPALSPDGQYVAFLSSRSVFSIDLYVADAETGAIVERLGSVNRDPHFDAIRFLESAGTWSPDGRRFAFVAFSKGDNELAIWNVQTGRIERRFSVQGVTAMSQPAWSPDGETIALSGLRGGISDLYAVDVATGTARQLTDDRYGDLQPTWAPDGDRLAFVTDRGPGGTDFATLEYGAPRLALMDVESGAVEVRRPFPRGAQYNPQFAPDGAGLYFISTHDGFKDVYHLDLASGRTARITALQTGVSGFTSLSPALSVAARSGRMAFSVFSDNTYSVMTLSSQELAERVRQGETGAPADSGSRPAAEAKRDTMRLGAEAVPQAGVLPPWTGGGLVEQSLRAPTAGLPEGEYEDVRPYRPRLQLDAIAPPAIGVAVGGGVGTRLGGSIGFYFSDMLGEHNLSVEALANGTFQDLGGQVTYVNRAQRFNYGAQVAHVPYLSRFGRVSRVPEGILYQETEQRIFESQFSLLGTYPLRPTRRFEAQTSLTRYGFDLDERTFLLQPSGIVRRTERDLDTRDPLYLSQSAAAYVVDFSRFGFTSPVQGGRYRLQVGATLGSTQYGTVLADLRRYLRTGPITVAGRLLHVGNYGAGDDDIFAQEYLGYSFQPSYLRGYSFYSFESEECFAEADDTEQGCPPLDRLIGTRVAVAGLEVRVPVFGTERFGLINVPYLPTELSAFVDGGVAWTADDPPVWEWSTDAAERVPVVSTGVSARMNLFGAAVVEVFYAYPFQRPEKGGFVGVGLYPGW